MLKLKTNELTGIQRIKNRFDLMDFIAVNDLDGEWFKLSNDAQRKLFGDTILLSSKVKISSDKDMVSIGGHGATTVSIENFILGNIW